MKPAKELRFGRGWGALLLVGMLLAAPGFSQLTAARAAAPARTLAEADQLYTEKSYAGALEAYQRFLAADQVPAGRKDEVLYRIVVSQGKSEKWDAALQASVAFVKEHVGTVWEPRGLYWLGRLYLGAPHQGWKVGARIYRGNDVPKVTESEAPEQISLAEQDNKNAHDALQAARVYYPAYRAANHTEAEEIQLGFDLARVLQVSPEVFTWAQAQKWAPPADPSWKLDPNATYSPDWAPPKQIRYLYAGIAALSRATEPKAHSAALAQFADAMWVRGYQSMMQNAAVRWENGKPVLIPYPYQNLRPEAMLRQLVKDFPEDPIRDQAQYTLATWLENTGQQVEAVAEYRRLVADRPASKWVEDSRARLEEITRKQFSLNLPRSTFMPGEAVQAVLSSRNVGSVHVEVYRVQLEAVLTRPEVVNDPRISFNQYQQNFGVKQEAAKRFYGPQVLKLDKATGDQGKYEYRSNPVPLALKEPGAYVIESSAPGLRTVNVVLISNLGVVQKLSRDAALLWTTDARTGQPIPGAKIVAKQVWHEGGVPHASVLRGTSDKDGLLRVPLEHAPNRQGFTVSALVQDEDRGYALTQPVGGWWGSDNPEFFRAYSQTDRAVYRPGQTVHYREVVLRRATNGAFKPAVNESVQVRVRDPRGNVLHDRTASASEFGSVNGELTVPADSPLGEYQVEVTVPRVHLSVQNNGGNRFRVEEYKKPEFEVSVEPTAARVRLGEPAAARLRTTYYFGGGVPDAKVTYRVYRTPWAQQFRFPRPFDFLHRYWEGGNYSVDYRQGEVVKQGETKTDAKGEAELSFPTTPPANGGSQDYTFTLEADVQDASRRVISGTGSLKATRHDVAVFLNFPRGYASQGDEVKVEVATRNPTDQPVSVAGTGRVFRYPDTPDGKEKEVFKEELKTDKEGRAYIRWNNREAGRYRVEFSTRDTAGQAVAGSTDVWVAGAELEHGKFVFRDIFLRMKDPYYQEGQTAKVLLVTPAPNCAVLLTREVNNQITERRVVRVPGRSVELSLPLTSGDVPNVYLSVVLLRDGTMFQAVEELFVPAVRQFTTVTVEADKQRYAPGEKGHLKLTAKDWRGQGVRTEVAVALTDASLSYIQQDYAPDIRLYYYGDRRSASVPQTASIGAPFYGVAEDTQPRGTYRVHEWLLPDGMGQLSDWPGADRAGYVYSRNYYFFDTYGGGMGGLGGGGGFGGGVRYRALGLESRAAGMVMDRAEIAKSMNAPMAKLSVAPTDIRAGADAEKQQQAQGLQEAQVRTKFADTAFWSPAAVTDAQGHATVEITYPENLTRWRAHGVGVTTQAAVGSGDTSVVTKKDLLVRLEAPRFFVERDVVALTAVVHNDTEKDQRVRVRLQIEGSAAVLDPERDRGRIPGGLKAAAPETWVEVPKGGQATVDWALQALGGGQLTVRMSAQTPSAADATEEKFPILTHGVERQLVQAGVLRGERTETATLGIALPAERGAGSSELVVQLNPSLAATMLDALPYLVAYPYGCIEQTVSRFLPAVLVRKTLTDLGYRLEDLKERAKILEAKEKAGDKAQPGGKTGENSPYTYPKGRPGTLRVSHLAAPQSRWHSPVFDSGEMSGIIREGLGKIQSMQNADGGWGWWPGNSSDPYMTSYALYGLLTAKDAGVAVDAGMLDRGLNHLKTRFLEEDNLHRMAYEARVLSLDPRFRDAIRPLTTGRVWDGRERLSPYSKALLALAMAGLGEREKGEVLLRNLETTGKRDETAGTAWWESTDRAWWYWWNDKVETNATVLQAYLALRPADTRVDPLAKWMVENRRGNSWYSTKETAEAVYALAAYTRDRKELSPEYTLTADLDGKVKREYTITRDNALLFDNQFVVPDELLSTGTQMLTLKKDGPGSLYYSAYTRYFSKEEGIKAASNGISVTRKYYRLKPGTASGTPPPVVLDENRPNPFLTHRWELLSAGGTWIIPGDVSDGPRYEREALAQGAVLASGDQVEVELTLEAQNDYEYLVFEDMKPSGCEAVELRSGGRGGNGVWANMELRDQKVAFFLNNLRQGRSQLSYRLRAEIPGAFHVLPTNGYAMYAPEIRAVSDEMELGVRP